MARVASVSNNTIISVSWGNALKTDYVSQTDTTEQDLASDLNVATNALKRTVTAPTLGAGIATFACVGEAMTITGDALANAVTTISAGITGQILILTFVDALVTLVNDDGHAANTIDLVGGANLVSADDTTLMLFYNGTSWYELSRSVN